MAGESWVTMTRELIIFLYHTHINAQTKKQTERHAYLLFICYWLDWQPSKCLDDGKFESFATRWRDSGAKLIGGCCRTTPSTIQAVSKVLKERSWGFIVSPRKLHPPSANHNHSVLVLTLLSVAHMFLIISFVSAVFGSVSINIPFLKCGASIFIPSLSS